MVTTAENNPAYRICQSPDENKKCATYEDEEDVQCVPPVLGHFHVVFGAFVEEDLPGPRHWAQLLVFLVFGILLFIVERVVSCVAQ